MDSGSTGTTMEYPWSSSMEAEVGESAAAMLTSWVEMAATRDTAGLWAAAGRVGGGQRGMCCVLGGGRGERAEPAALEWQRGGGGRAARPAVQLERHSGPTGGLQAGERGRRRTLRGQFLSQGILLSVQVALACRSLGGSGGLCRCSRGGLCGRGGLSLLVAKGHNLLQSGAAGCVVRPAIKKGAGRVHSSLSSGAALGRRQGLLLLLVCSSASSIGPGWRQEACQAAPQRCSSLGLPACGWVFSLLPPVGHGAGAAKDAACGGQRGA